MDVTKAFCPTSIWTGSVIAWTVFVAFSASGAAFHARLAAHLDQMMEGGEFSVVFHCCRDSILECDRNVFSGDVMSECAICNVCSVLVASLWVAVCVVTKEQLSYGHRCAPI